MIGNRLGKNDASSIKAPSTIELKYIRYLIPVKYIDYRRKIEKKSHLAIDIRHILETVTRK